MPQAPVTYRDFLAAKAAELRTALSEEDASPFLDASLILAHCLGISRSALLARLPEKMPEPPSCFFELWARRLSGESVAYVVGKKEFFGRGFLVDRRVLAPRPDTEILVEAALETGDAIMRAASSDASSDAARSGVAPGGSGGLRLHDLCTGSGAVAISLAAERSAWTVSASDISAEALDVARRNAIRLLDRSLSLVQADLLEGIKGPFDIITANPPYVSSEETRALLARGWKEPALALDGGVEGLDVVARLVAQAKTRLSPGGFLLIETDALQSRALRDMLQKAGFDGLRTWKDLAGRARVTGARNP